MKLIKRTYLQTAIWIIPVIVAGSIFCFYIIKHIVYEETDEFLTYEMERLLNYYEENNNLPEFHKVAAIIEDMKYESPVFKDTMILEPGDNELVPHRELYFTITHNNIDFTIVLRHLLPGNDDIFEGTLLIISGLVLLIAIILFLMVNYISGKVWNPFYKTLNALTGYRITNPVPAFPPSRIDEFNTLNETVKGLLGKTLQDYQRTKEYNENASHELQTHLAVIRANTEHLLNSPEHCSKYHEQIQAIHNATIKLSRAQKSLLLLSKIGNLEYNNNTNLNLSDVVNNALSLFQEAITIRNISVESKLENCTLFMDAGLADIMVDNLLKNAVKHNLQDGHIRINLTQNSLMVENSGVPFSGNTKTLFERFIIGTSGNLGIGLAIVKQICDIYNYKISYDVNENLHKIEISFRLN